MNDKGITMQRSIERWKNCNPIAMTYDQSPFAISYAFQDARDDIIALYKENQRLQSIIESNKQFDVGYQLGFSEGEIAGYDDCLQQNT